MNHLNVFLPNTSYVLFFPLYLRPTLFFILSFFVISKASFLPVHAFGPFFMGVSGLFFTKITGGPYLWKCCFLLLLFKKYHFLMNLAGKYHFWDTQCLGLWYLGRVFQHVFSAKILFKLAFFFSPQKYCVEALYSFPIFC